MQVWYVWRDTVAGALAVLQAGPGGELALFLFVAVLFYWVGRRLLPGWGRGWR